MELKGGDFSLPASETPLFETLRDRLRDPGDFLASGPSSRRVLLGGGSEPKVRTFVGFP